MRIICSLCQSRGCGDKCEGLEARVENDVIIADVNKACAFWTGKDLTASTDPDGATCKEKDPDLKAIYEKKSG